MRVVVGNVSTKVIIGGTDYLLGFDVMETLRKYLRVKPDGYSYSEAYQEHNWDGYRYFITPKGEFATGYLPMVLSYMAELGVPCVIEDNRGELPKLKADMSNYVGYIDGEDWYGLGNDEIGWYQLEMAKKLNNYIKLPNGDYMYFPRGILDCATNAGKNSIAALIVNNLERRYRTIFLVSSKDIYKQAVEFFSQVIGEPVGEINDRKFAPSEFFTVAMVKSLYSKAKKSINVKKLLFDTEVLFVDESDESGSKEYSRCLSYINAPMRIFMSGTPLEAKKVNNMVSIGLSGKVLGTVTNKFLIDNGFSQRPTVKIYLNVMPEFKFHTYTGEVDRHIHCSKQRADLICKLIEERKGKNILITFIEKKHGYFMYERIKELLPDLIVDIVHGEDKDRAIKLQNFKDGYIQVLLASMIVKKGLNIPIIRSIFMAQGGKSTITVKQLAGRGTRKDGIHDDVEFVEFYDMGKYVSKHSRQRIRIYKNEGFDIEYTFPCKNGKPDLSKIL